MWRRARPLAIVQFETLVVPVDRISLCVRVRRRLRGVTVGPNTPREFSLSAWRGRLGAVPRAKPSLLQSNSLLEDRVQAADSLREVVVGRINLAQERGDDAQCHQVDPWPVPWAVQFSNSSADDLFEHVRAFCGLCRGDHARPGVVGCELEIHRTELTSHDVLCELPGFGECAVGGTTHGVVAALFGFNGDL